MRIKVNNGRLYTYADVSVIRDPAILEDEQQDTLLNPIVIIEVLSPSTELDDRGNKFQHYRELASLQEYILIALDEARIEHYRRKSQREWWYSNIVRLEAIIELPSIECTLALADVYNKISFEPDEAAPPT